jgi:DNA-binding beta-propeller fold protein YncE
VSTSSATVTPIRTATNTALKPIKIGKPPAGYEFPDQIAITPNGRTAYVSTTAGVVPIRTATNTALKLIKVGNGQPAQPGPSPIAITPNGKTAYVVNLIAGTVTPISTAANAPGRPVAVKSSPGVMLDGIGIAPDGRTAFILNEVFEPASFPGTVIPFRTATNTQGKPITVGSAPSAIVFAR